jgi:P-type conjugative transfer protein TrbJ
MIGITAASPAHAQFGGIVYDPTNYAQNVLTAARSLQQINNQIQQIQKQATSLVNEARNLASLPFSSLQQLQQQVQRTQQLLGEAQRIAYDVQNVQQAFNGRYKGAALTGTHAQMVANANARWEDSVGAFEDALRFRPASSATSTARARRCTAWSRPASRQPARFRPRRRATSSSRCNRSSSRT